MLLSVAPACWAAPAPQVMVTGARARQVNVTLIPSEPGPLPAGTIVTWRAEGGNAAALWYRFRVRKLGQEFHVVRDFGPIGTLDWTGAPGIYEVEVTAREREWRATGTARAIFQMTVRSERVPVISATPHPLVFLYSAPPCPADGRMRVKFQAAGGAAQSTLWQECPVGTSLDFYLAGMRPETEYMAHQVMMTAAGTLAGPPLTLTTGPLPAGLGSFQVPQPWPGAPGAGMVLLAAFGPTIATDLEGNIVWYQCCLTNVTRPVGNGRFLGILAGQGDQSDQVLREFDLLGLTQRETNAARVNEQLAARGMGRINAFHHDAQLLPDGKILALAGTERVLTGVQGDGPVNILGDMILVLDRDMQVEWAWDAFDHLDVRRKAVLDETCQGCPKLFLGTAEETRDWLHGNSVALTPDGNILYSARNQDLLFKIDYRGGSGSGAVIWRLGKDGDFQFDSSDPYPWFSHQHEAEFESGDTLSLFDNGNTRVELNPGDNSRGQVIQLDERNRVAHLLLNVDLGKYSFALGSAQELENGDVLFDNGWLTGPDTPWQAESTAVDASGQAVFRLDVSRAVYRSFAMADIYGVP